MDQFLNPKSMLTPGVAGAMTMAIANSLWWAFSWPQKYSGLAISFMFALVVFVAHGIPVWQRGVFYVLNGLIVFSVAIGANAAGVGSSGVPSSAVGPTARFVISSHLASPGVSWSDVYFSGDASLDTGVVAAFTSAVFSGDTSGSATIKVSSQEYMVNSFPTQPTFFADVIQDSLYLERLDAAGTAEVAQVVARPRRGFFHPWFAVR